MAQTMTMTHTTDVDRLATDMEALAAKGVKDNSTRARLLKAAQHIVAELEDPRESIIRTVFAPFEIASARIGNDLNIFGILNDSSEPISTEKLAAKTGADDRVLERILRHLATMDFIKQVTPTTWTSSRLTKALHDGAPGIFHHSESYGRAILALPTFLQKNKYHPPEDIHDTAFTYAHPEAPTYYDWFAMKPKDTEMFHLWMINRPYRTGHWLNVFPFEEVVSKPTDKPEDVIFVDVGGGRGNQCLEIRKRFPNVKGRLVLEDSASVISGAVQAPNLDVQEVDFFKGQPVKGARTYFLRSVLHNWPSKDCRTILAGVKAAMAPDSIILIDEMVLPEMGTSNVSAIMDIAMMLTFMSEERTEKRWTELLDSVGLRIEKIYRYDERAHSSIIQVRLKEDQLPN